MPSVEQTRAAYQKRVDAILAQITRRDEASIKEALKILRQFRRVAIDRFYAARTESETVWFIRMQKAADEEVARLESLLMKISNQSIDDMADMGRRALEDPLRAAGYATGGISGIDPNLIVAAKNYSADLIGLNSGGLAADALKRINSEISLGILGQQPVQTVIKNIASVIGDDSTLFTAAERIFRTEGLTIASLAQQAAAVQANEIVPMVKTWVWSGVSRTTHEEADGQTVPVGEKFKIRNPNGGFDMADYPRDPSLPPEQRINCGCAMAVEPDFEALEEAA